LVGQWRVRLEDRDSVQYLCEKKIQGKCFCELTFFFFRFNGGIEEQYLCDRKMMLHPIGSGKPVAYDQRRCAVWVCAGETYEHKGRSSAAVKVFSELNWPVKFSLLKGVGADWPTGLEEEVWAWFCTARDDALIDHVSSNVEKELK
jgi:hypothetical protein